MAKLVFLAMFVFVVLLWSMALTAGTQKSISALAYKWRWLLLAALWSQVLLLPQMFAITPDPWRWLAFIGIGAIGICGGASITDKADEWVHIIAAVVAFTALTGWVMVVNDRCLMPLIVCIAAGRENWKWRIEVGLVISVYMVLVLTF